MSLQEKIDDRAARLTAYQDEAYARRYQLLVQAAPEALRETVAISFYKLLAYKDEYEVARLHLTSADQARTLFTGDLKLRFHLAPPVLGGTGPDGRPRKREFGAWILPVFRLLARMKGLRGGPFDPFGRSAERREERAAITRFETDMAEVFRLLTAENLAAAQELAALPLSVRGYGPVRAAAAQQAEIRRAALLDLLRKGPTAPQRSAA